MNTFNCTGHLGSDADVRQAGSSTICTFSVAVKSGYGDKETTMWLRANLWGKRAEGNLPAYLKKGSQVAISGELSLNAWTNKDGVEKTNLEVNVSTLDLIGSKKEPSQPQQQNQGYNEHGTGQDVPF